MRDGPQTVYQYIGAREPHATCAQRIDIGRVQMRMTMPAPGNRSKAART
jgi:hypothetical protein